MAKQDNLPSIGILTIIGPELRAVKSALGITEADRIMLGDGTFCYGTVIENDFIGPVQVFLWSIGTAGNTSSAADAAKLIGQGIKFLILCGIAGGMRTKVKIGDVVVPRAIVDATVKVADGASLKPRPLITGPLKGVVQMNCAIEIAQEELHKEFGRLSPKQINVPAGQEDEYRENVAVKPGVHESAILSDDLLVRDPSVMVDAAKDLHQQIRATEMEAAGIVQACNGVYPPVPWFVIRGISDFGDDFKNDLFHDHASKAVAAYVSLYIKHVVDLRIWHKLSEIEVPPTGTPTMFLQDIIAKVEQVSDANTSSKLLALNKAFTVTFAYLSQLSIPDSKIDPATRIQLSVLWHEAAMEVKDFDQDLYESCFKKSGYWIDPSRWNEHGIKAGGFSYNELLERLKVLGFANAPAATVDSKYAVELDHNSLDNHIMLETVVGHWVNTPAPPGMNSWDIENAIANIIATPEIIEKMPSLLLGGITVLLSESMYRKWRRKRVLTLDATFLGQEANALKSELPLGKRKVTGSFRPSEIAKIRASLKNDDPVWIDFELQDQSVCAVSCKLERVQIDEERSDGSTIATVDLDIETSERLFSKYQYTTRLLFAGAPLIKVQEALIDALSENGWKGEYSDVRTNSSFKKQLRLVDNETEKDVTFETSISLEHNGSKTVLKITVSERTFYSLITETMEQAVAISSSINSRLK